jgi:flagellar biosynthetic protein FlhB
MAEDDEERTEEASDHRVSEAHNEGNVPVSRDATTIAGLAAAAAVLVAVAPALERGLLNCYRQAFTHMGDGKLSDFAGPAIPVLGYMLLVIVAAAGTSAAAVLFQTGFGVWLEKALPDLTRLGGGGGGIGRIFTKDYVVDLGITLAKVSAVSWVGWKAIQPDLVGMARLFDLPAPALLSAFEGPLTRLITRLVVVLGLFAAGDWFLTRRRFMQKMKMTKEEVKREHKEQEGDPAIKGRRRRKARELVRQMARKEVPRADVVVTNPTHLAVALRYRKNEGMAPRVTAKGAGPLAELMKDLARSNGVPMVEDVALARLLYRRVRIGGQVPEQTFKTVAAILAFVYRITRRMPG